MVAVNKGILNYAPSDKLPFSLAKLGGRFSRFFDLVRLDKKSRAVIVCSSLGTTMMLTESNNTEGEKGASWVRDKDLKFSEQANWLLLPCENRDVFW